MPLSTPDLTLYTARLSFEDKGLAREYLFIDTSWRDHRMFALRNAAFVGTPT